MSDSTKKTETFILNIYNRQNATWQGSVTWVEKKEKQQFRSALELLKLIESALDEEEVQKRHSVRQNLRHYARPFHRQAQTDLEDFLSAARTHIHNPDSDF